MIPCENCITLSVCKTIWEEFHNLEGIFMTTLERRCSIMNTHTTVSLKDNSYMSSLDQEYKIKEDVISFFRGGDNVG